MDDLIKVAGLWENTSKSGNVYLAGYLGKARLLLFKNREKEPDSKEPDWEIFLAPGKEQREAQGEQRGQQGEAPASAQAATPPSETRHRKMREDELPEKPW